MAADLQECEHAVGLEVLVHAFVVTLGNRSHCRRFISVENSHEEALHLVGRRSFRVQLPKCADQVLLRVHEHA